MCPFQPSLARSLHINAARLRVHPPAGSSLRPTARPITTSLPPNNASANSLTPSPSKPELPLGTPNPTEAPPAPLAAVPAPRLFDLTNRTIIVAGAARGLGLTVARAFLEAGAHVQALDLLPKPDEPAWSQTQKVASDRGVTLTYGTLDVTDQQQVHDVFEKCFDAAPTNAPVRGLFVSAGIQLMIDAIDYPADKFRKLIDVNLTGTFLCAQAFAREWTTRNPNSSEAVEKAEHSVSTGNTASIVMTASMSGSVANRGINAAPYNASKAGVVQLGRNLAMEWGERGIRVNVSRRSWASESHLS